MGRNPPDAEKPENTRKVALGYTRILIADQEPLFLHGIRASIEVKATFQVIGESTTSQQALSNLSLHKPDLLIIGFRLACGRDTLGLAPEFRNLCPGIAIIVLLPRNSGSLTRCLLLAGVRGVLARSSPCDALLTAVRNVLAGGAFVDPSLATSQPRTDSTAGQCDPSTLTSREREIFHLLGMEKSYKEIAALLGISTKTVERHRENIKAKLCFGSSCALTLAAKARVLWESSGVDYII